MRKKGKTVPAGGAYDMLPTVAGRNVDLQSFVDHYVEHGNQLEAYLASGGDPKKSDKVARSTASQIMALPEVQQAVVERSAQKFFDLAPVAVKVLKDILEMKSDDPRVLKTKVQVATQVMDKIQVEKHHIDKQAAQQKAIDVAGDIGQVMKEFNEFISKNPEWQSQPRRNTVIIDADATIPVVEEHKST